MPANATHRCLCCQVQTIPTYRALCPDCFDIVPWRLRANVIRDHGGRLKNKTGFEETLIRLRQWHIGYVGEDIDDQE